MFRINYENLAKAVKQNSEIDFKEKTNWYYDETINKWIYGRTYCDEHISLVLDYYHYVNEYVYPNIYFNYYHMIIIIYIDNTPMSTIHFDMDLTKPVCLQRWKGEEKKIHPLSKDNVKIINKWSKQHLK